MVIVVKLIVNHTILFRGYREYIVSYSHGSVCAVFDSY